MTLDEYKKIYLLLWAGLSYKGEASPIRYNFLDETGKYVLIVVGKDGTIEHANKNVDFYVLVSNYQYAVRMDLITEETQIFKETVLNLL